MKQVEDFLSKLDGLGQDVSLIIDDSLYGCMKHPWDVKENNWDRDQFDEVFKFAKNFGQVIKSNMILLINLFYKFFTNRLFVRSPL